MRTPVYLAGASVDVERVKAMAARLQETGLVRITFAWFDQVAEQREAGLHDRDLGTEEQRARARADLAGVNDAAVFWALWPAQPSNGCAFEFGHVCGKEDVYTIVSGPTVGDCIFTSLANCRTEHDDAAFDAVMALVGAFHPRSSRSVMPDALCVGERP